MNFFDPSSLKHAPVGCSVSQNNIYEFFSQATATARMYKYEGWSLLYILRSECYRFLNFALVYELTGFESPP